MCGKRNIVTASASAGAATSSIRNTLLGGGTRDARGARERKGKATGLKPTDSGGGGVQTVRIPAKLLARAWRFR